MPAILASIGTVAAAASTAKTVTKHASDLNDKVGDLRDRNITSLAKFSSISLLESPCFIQDSLAEEPVINDILKNLYNVYIGYILASLQMNQQIVGSKTIRDIISTVATTGSYESFIDTSFLVQGLSGSVEAFGLSPLKKSINTNSGKAAVGSINERPRDKQISIPISSGRIIDVSIKVAADADPVTFTLQVKFNPRLITEPVVEYVFGQDYTRSISDRWLQYKAGEIRFIKDFIFSVDKLERRAKALKADRDHALSDILRYKNTSTFKHGLKLATKKGSYNLANSILIVDEATEKMCTKKLGFDLNKPADRHRFFDNTYNLFIVLVDTRYSRVTIYTNGIDQSASYSFNELKASAASDKMSLKDVMEYLSKNQLPRF